MTPTTPPETNESARRSITAEFAWIAAYLPLVLAFTWPLAPRLGTHLAGDAGDGWQNLWNISWVWRSLYEGRSPFWTDALHHPSGASLVFQTFDLPDAVLFAPLLAFLPPVTVYGVVVLWTFFSAGATGFLSARILGASRPAAFLSGAALTFSTFHFGHALGHLHILAVQWVPLFVAGLFRAIEDRSWRWGLFGGVAAGLAGLSSWYHLFACVLLGAVLTPFAMFRSRARGWSSAVLPVGVLVGAVLLVAGPWAWAIVREREVEPIAGAHAATTFSADLQSFVWPNGAQALAGLTSQWRKWTGNPAENATYLGWILLALMLWGLVRRVPRAAALATAALVGVAISLGPRLHVGGALVTGEVLPYAWLERWVPVLGFTGVPVRLASVATVALALGLAPALDELAKRRGWRLAAILGALAIAEHAPHGYVTSRYPAPAPIVAWSSDPRPWAVLDATRDSRHLYHQVLHGHPIVGGYLTRTPVRLEQIVETHPVAGPLLAWDAPDVVMPIQLELLDFAQGRTPIPEIDPRRFTLDATTTLEVTTPGEWRFEVECDDGARLWVDGARVVENGGVHPRQTRDGAVTLSAGSHPLRVTYEQSGGDAMLRVKATGPDGVSYALGPFTGQARVRRRMLRGSREEALARLRADRVARIVVDANEERFLLETQLGLQPAFVGDGVRIYEVPGAE